MRVIGGSGRGRRLPARLPPGVRPTSDRVREAIFDVLGSMGGVEGLAVADLYCGSGAMGVEALSRGAASVVFVDRDPEALEAVRANLAATGLADLPGRRVGTHDRERRGRSGPSVSVVRAELPGWLHGAHHFDLALCDPPYEFSEWGTLMAALRADVAVLESSLPFDVPAGWAVTRSRRYGGTLVTVARTNPFKTPAEAQAPARAHSRAATGS